MTTETNCREIVLDLLIEILEKGCLGHLVLKQALEKYQYLGKQDRAFITRATEGTLEYVIQIDAVIDRFSKVKVKQMKPVIREILRMSVYQILYMDRVPDAAACNEAVKLAGKRRFQGLSGFVNGVLRTVCREKASLVFEDPALRYSLPEWLFAMWERELGRERAEQAAAACLAERPLSVRCNESLASVEEILENLRRQGIQAERSEWFSGMLSISGYDNLASVEAFQRGWITVQDASSYLVGLAASPKEGDFVLDVCSAPGGKALHAADLLRGSGMVEARDLTEYKISLIEENKSRCGFSNLRTKVWDAGQFDPSMEEKADIVLADLPCSGLGVIGKKPDIKLRVKEEDIPALAGLQRRILSVVSRYVKPGGVLIYSTCTVNREENQENAGWILRELPFEKRDITGLLPEKLRGGCEENQIQLLPGIHPCDGFFLASFRKVEGRPA